MSKKHFIAMADAIREHNRFSIPSGDVSAPFNAVQIEALANFCRAQNPAFNRERWIGYINGENGPNGGAR